MMGRLGIWVLHAVVGAAFMMLFSSSKIGGGGGGDAVKLHSDLNSANRGVLLLTHVEDIGPMITNRKLKERSQRMRADRAHDLGRIETEDYPPFDPSPNSKAMVKAGPIEHGTPLMPYIPRPTPPLHQITPPPSNPKHGYP
ncbi:uncharacterized protein LOC109708527 [Ananas comosus]|uniref:Uncharacterized protein LOC109708527 n=1 Tax=Ananas comosus TaxID=4615 RepID=A0A6P5EQT8_ANACO|nr:uncharacterized protein LOC109708527 [Ananas comosus]